MQERSGSAEKPRPARPLGARPPGHGPRPDARRQGREAYRLASRHWLTEGADFADLEWLSGYLALTYLKEPAKALEHFTRFRQSVDTPISLGRAGYWEGRALEAMGRPIDAQAAYEFGAEFQTSFYGLLAAEKAGLPMDPALMGPRPIPTGTMPAFLQILGRCRRRCC